MIRGLSVMLEAARRGVESEEVMLVEKERGAREGGGKERTSVPMVNGHREGSAMVNGNGEVRPVTPVEKERTPVVNGRATPGSVVGREKTSVANGREEDRMVVDKEMEKEKTPVPVEEDRMVGVENEKTPVPVVEEDRMVAEQEKETPVVEKEKTPTLVPVEKEKAPTLVPVEEKTPPVSVTEKEKIPTPLPVPAEKEKTPIPVPEKEQVQVQEKEKTPIPVSGPEKEQTPVPVIEKEKTPPATTKEQTSVPASKEKTPPATNAPTPPPPIKDQTPIPPPSAPIPAHKENSPTPITPISPHHQLPTPPSTVLQRATSLPAASPLSLHVSLPQLPAVIYEPSRDPRRKSLSPPTPVSAVTKPALAPPASTRPTLPVFAAATALTPEEMQARRKQAVMLAIKKAFPPYQPPPKKPEASSSSSSSSKEKEERILGKEALVNAAQNIQVALQAQERQNGRELGPFRIPGLSLDMSKAKEKEKERVPSPNVYWKEPAKPATPSLVESAEEKRERERELVRRGAEAMKRREEMSQLQAFLDAQRVQQERERMERERVERERVERERMEKERMEREALAAAARPGPPMELDLGGGEMDMDIDGGADSDIENVLVPSVPSQEKEKEIVVPPTVVKTDAFTQTDVVGIEIGTQTVVDKIIQTSADASVQVVIVDKTVETLQDKVASLEMMFNMEAQKTSSLQAQLADVSQRLLTLEAHKSFISSSFAQRSSRSQTREQDRDSEASTPPGSSHSLPTPELPPNNGVGQLPEPDPIPGLSSTTPETAGYLNTDQGMAPQFNDDMPFAGDHFPLPIKSQRKRKYRDFIA